MSKIFFRLFFVQVILFALVILSTGQTNTPRNDDNSFEIMLTDSDYSLAYSISVVLTNKRLDVIYQGGIVREKDTLLFSKSLQSSDTLKRIVEIDVEKLKNYYVNSLVSDGSQLTVSVKKNNKSKTIHLANYYQEDIGKMVHLINSLLPDKYKIWYDKKQLQADEKLQNSSKLKKSSSR